jgi:outer membrane protein OmpA-like peptidoglycan-associated protein
MARIRIEPGGKILIAVIVVAAVLLIYWKLKPSLPLPVATNHPMNGHPSQVRKESNVDTSKTYTRQTEIQEAPNAPVRIYFDFNRSEINKNVYCIFDKIEKAVKEKELNSVEIIVEGNADSTGPQWYNLILSKRRAERVADSLSRRLKLPRNKIKIVANGSSKPISSNLTRSGRADNRRVEVLVY